jgi:hypothetical protein
MKIGDGRRILDMCGRGAVSEDHPLNGIGLGWQREEDKWCDKTFMTDTNNDKIGV